jgi:hypothetical protein
MSEELTTPDIIGRRDRPVNGIRPMSTIGISRRRQGVKFMSLIPLERVKTFKSECRCSSAAHICFGLSCEVSDGLGFWGLNFRSEVSSLLGGRGEAILGA